MPIFHSFETVSKFSSKIGRFYGKICLLILKNIDSDSITQSHNLSII